jgi:tRNA threonylcarbamoyladenosine biosynthesis protein TsaE
MIEVPLDDIAATGALGRALAGALARGDVVALAGPLGAGKTTLARGIIRACAERAGTPPPEEVPSPTYTLVQVYDLAPVPVWHFDLYRIERPEDALELAVDEAFAAAISLIEWPGRLGPYLPAERLDVTLALGAGDARRATIKGQGARGRALEEALVLDLGAGVG